MEALCEDEENPGQRPGLNMDVVCMAYPTECILRRAIGKKTCDFEWLRVSSAL